MVHEASSWQQEVFNEEDPLSAHPKGDEILNRLLQSGDERQNIFCIDQYKDTDLANFVHLLSKVCVCENYEDKAKPLLEKIYTKCGIFLYNGLLQRVIDGKGSVDVDIFTFVTDYFEVVKASVILLDSGWKALDEHLPSIQRLVDKLLVLDVESAEKAVHELQVLQNIINGKRKILPAEQPRATEPKIPATVEMNPEIANVTDLLNLNGHDLEKALQSSLRKQKDLATLLHLISDAYTSKNKDIKRYLTLFNRDGSCMSLENVLQIIYKAIDEENVNNIQKIVLDYFITIKAFVKVSDKSIEYVQGIFPDLQKLVKKLIRSNVQGTGKVLYELDKINRYCAERSKTHVRHDMESSPNDNFRKLSIVPRKSDIFDCDIPYLRKNVIDKPYDSIEHYLDVHFRLMREDMMRAFRTCLLFGKRKLSKTHQHLDNGRLYTKVQVHYPPEYTLDGVSYKITVKNVTKTTNLLNSKYLKPGSLICLSFDKFVTIIFATIRERTEGDEKGIQLTVVLEHVREKLSRKMKYALVESDGYFEPYRHVLQLLKDIRKEEFPLADCIVYLNFRECETKYLKGTPFVLKAKNLTEVDQSNTNLYKAFNIFDLRQWPSYKVLGLDEKQLEAFQVSLTKKLALIQGPPGTGKTYLACKIVETMLINNVGRPISICCASNHALDKFLNRLLKYTKKIVRIGSQGRSDVLQPHVLTHLVSAQKLYRSFGESCVDQMDNLQKLSLSILQAIYPETPKTKDTTKSDGMRYAIMALCDELNELYKDYVDCFNNYFCDGIINKIINSEDKQKIIAGAGSCRNVLKNCVIEWLVLYKSSEDIHKQCEKVWKELLKNGSYAGSEEDIDEDVMDDGKKKKKESEENIWRIPVSKRFVMFYKWRKRFLRQVRSKIKENKERYYNIFRKMKRRVHADTAEILKNADIIGMTTCGAAKYHEHMLEARPKVMIIEEAAEVFESHVISALVPSIEHLILIGDHEQLKPVTTSYDLGREFLLDISMFERLLKNGAPSVRLTKQYRMRPEIADLLVPFIYKTLESDERVTQYSDIVGLASNVFFLSHKVNEDYQELSRISSNDFEAQFVSKLCEYLLSQGYKQSQITILVAYYGQLEAVLRHIKFQVKDLQICTIDSYQGEENDIIIVSYVRSNIYRDIGFLSQSDRVCVSLSRAKLGLYCIGNFDMLASKSKLWESLVERLESQGIIGMEFPICCRNHREETLHIQQPDEFTDFLANGCGARCDFLLDCGHRCSRSCHFNDPLHENYKCMSPCTKQIVLKGKLLPCRKLCWEECRKKKICSVTLPCGHEIRCKEADAEMKQLSYKCDEECEKLLPCGHFVAVPCYRSADVTFSCCADIQVVLNCGHKKMMPCSKFCNSESWGTCSEFSVRMSPCGHIVSVPCADIDDDDVALLSCEKSCDKLLNCGHPCTGFCKACFSLKIHEICWYECDLKLPCGHNCQSWCGMPCPPCEQACDIRCSHSTCPNRCERPCVQCVEPCDRGCQHKTCNKKCWEICSPCRKPCNQILKCGHQCIGMCGAPCPTLCRICNSKEINSPKPNTDLFVLLEDCSHVVEVSVIRECIQNSIQSFKWPVCPLCNVKITRNVHFDMQLKQMKSIILQSIDPMDEFGKVKKLVDVVFPRSSTIPWKFGHLELAIRSAILSEKPAYSFLYTLKQCLTSIKKMKDVEGDITGKIPRLECRFDEILKWITNHLLQATYQQLQELHSEVEHLVTFAREYAFS